jgi:hypothetical protein
MIDSSPLGNSRAQYLRIALASGHVPLAQSAVNGISENHIRDAISGSQSTMLLLLAGWAESEFS